MPSCRRRSLPGLVLLARSCAYYHDIGKGRNPAYFGENQKGENAHDTLAPAMSAVREGWAVEDKVSLHLQIHFML